MDIDPQILTNFIFCVIILSMGVTAYIKNRRTWALLLGAAFGFFGVSHLFTLLDLKETLEGLLYAVRIAGYGLTFWVVYWYGCRKYSQS